MTPETYLGYSRLQNYVGTAISPDADASYKLPSDLPQNTIAYGGRWHVGAERIVALQNASLRLHFHAKDVYIVLGGRGSVHASIDGKPARTVNVDSQRLYTVVSAPTTHDATLELRFSPGIEAYSFTFG
jgi:mannose-6-phosphate isomerase-like protein (cupin superfamily)